VQDRCLEDKQIFEMMQEENLRQINKWGIQDHSPFEWLVILMEEVGELSQAILTTEWGGEATDNIGERIKVANINIAVKEAIQVATLALKIAEMYLEKGEKGKKVGVEK